RLDQIADDFILPVDGDRFASGELGQIDAMPRPAKADIESLVAQAGASQSCTDTHRVQQVHCPLLQDSRSHAVDDVVAAAVLDDDRVDAIQMQQMAKQQPGRACANDPDLRPESAQSEPGTAHEVGCFVGATAALV